MVQKTFQHPSPTTQHTVHAPPRQAKRAGRPHLRAQIHDAAQPSGRQRCGRGLLHPYATLVTAGEQMHVDEQRPATHDLDDLAGSAGRPPTAAQALPDAATLRERSGGPPVAAVHQSDDRGPRHEPARGHRCGLHGRQDGDRGPPIARERTRQAVRAHESRLVCEDWERVDLLAVPLRRPPCRRSDGLAGLAVLGSAGLERLAHEAKCRRRPRPLPRGP
jgi:hypothetical protein